MESASQSRPFLRTLFLLTHDCQLSPESVRGFLEFSTDASYQHFFFRFRKESINKMIIKGRGTSRMAALDRNSKNKISIRWRGRMRLLSPWKRRSISFWSHRHINVHHLTLLRLYGSTSHDGIHLEYAEFGLCATVFVWIDRSPLDICSSPLDSTGHSHIPRQAFQDDISDFGSALWETAIGHLPYPDIQPVPCLFSPFEKKHSTLTK